MVHVTAEAIARLPPEARTAFLADLTAGELLELQFDWRIWARREQLPPEEDHTAWVILAGRGWGKTKTGAETVRAEVESGRRARIGICSPTTAVLRRDVIEGPAGLLETARPDFRPVYEPSTLRLTWPNGCRAHLFSAEEPDRVRGANLDYAWLDEFAAFPDPQGMLDMLRLALRLDGPQGHAPRLVVTTTPRPIAALAKLLKAPGVVITKGRTQDNRANLSESAITALEAEYGGTRMGRQELDGELLTDNPGALWNETMIAPNRVAVDQVPLLRRVVVAVDPSGGSRETNAETGIVVAGIDHRDPAHFYILGDASGRHTPDQWARRAVDAYRLHRADCIVAERNYGGDMVLNTIRSVTWNVPTKLVTATRGKAIRAEPAAALYEQGRVHHAGIFEALETQLCEWSPTGGAASPDRLDATVWALAELAAQQVAAARMIQFSHMGR